MTAVAPRATTRRRTDDGAATTRGILSVADRRRPGTRRALWVITVVLSVFLLIVGLGPLLWLAKSAITPTQDTLRTPMALWPNGFDWANVGAAWSEVHIDRYFFNTVAVAIGAWVVQIVVATTAGYALSILRPRYAPILTGLVLATLFVPAIVLLVPLYLVILDPPVVGTPLINTYWAVWLPAGANAFNILLVKRFFDNLPQEVIDAARTDGAGPFRLFVSIVLPMSRPILGVVSVFAIIATWKDYLWPLLVLPDPDMQPLSVRLPTLQGAIELDVFLAALFISSLIPIGVFLLFQRFFLNAEGVEGAVKG
jgi:multiple sugar transport system permease protein